MRRKQVAFLMAAAGAHGRDSAEVRAVARAKARGTRTGYVYSAIDGHACLAYTEALDNRQAATAFLGQVREWFAKHGTP